METAQKKCGNPGHYRGPLQNNLKTTCGVFLCPRCNKTWEKWWEGNELFYYICQFNLPTLGLKREKCPLCEKPKNPEYHIYEVKKI